MEENENLIERIEKIEDLLNIMKYNFEFTQKFAQSTKEVNEEFKTLMDSTTEYIKDVNNQIIDLQDSFVVLSKNLDIQRQLTESQGRSIKYLTQTIELLIKK